MTQLTEESRENELVARKGVDLHSNETRDPGNQHFSKDNNLSSMFLSVDTTDFSLASLSLDSDIVLDEVQNSNCTLQPHLDVNASTSPSTDVMHFDTQNTAKEIIGFKLEKELDVGECDIIDGFMIHSFTTADALEQFVASRAAEKTLKLSSRLKKARKLAPSFFRDVNSMDASLFVLSAEPYYEDYNVPFPPNKRRLTVECLKRFCTMGCICDSLNSTRPFYEHCNHPECMFDLVCCYKHKLRYRDSPSPTKRYDSRDFNKFSDNALLKQLSSIKEEIYFKTDLIDRLVSELNEKQLEIDNLKKQLMGKSIFRSNITLRPSPLQSEASATVKKVKAEEDKKGKMKERPKVEIKKEAEGRRVKAKVEVKEAKGKISHAHADGLYANSFPFDERFLNRLAENTTCSIFVRQLMRHTFTFDFLASANCSSMNDEHMAAIIDATMKRFKFYHRNNGEFVHVTPELVKKVIVSEFNLKQTQKKRKRM
ncbi:uncharacterized protein LOC124342696 isoform X1 [Daphnia pulicaria]|uniref:uncharacterized protein LOC124342696 isoform X1 n=1 Tax=Daphnia pulicaria TaxID=35523 RepID=UPI001EEC0EA6|nr:uncharacterized protein LOC124342696 isoform X1 [Daphnia pulicaria]XP_046651763.1 uncharacterized protein LOC124342696 isoform X1 [Daphnia pulicaria]XP_046651764.1 uncharacterized protein LOC124342696 isoform X1 [Daphnia pulicaria]XP_046651765.1 uncharacterized protein LOC124342696 isoform X1 [Daphnia pulicaria]